MSLSVTEAVYDGCGFVPAKPISLPRNQIVFFRYSLRKDTITERRSAAELVSFLQNSPLNDPSVRFDRNTTNALRGMHDGQFA